MYIDGDLKVSLSSFAVALTSANTDRLFYYDNLKQGQS